MSVEKKVVPNMRPNYVDRYLVQFKEAGKDYFKTDCAFRDGQLEKAKAYVNFVCQGVSTIVGAQVLDAWRGQVVS